MPKSFVILSDSKTLDCHFELSLESEKSAPLVILSNSEISKEFKIRFKFKVKNPRFKGTNLHFKSWILRCAQYDKGK